ncbi:phosphate ABC transporter ATP-binding protein [Calothrix sp. NIES-3974]|uniref:phosphate ABC transporter ATP-binding protein n=1 Tax=Calothrix sp. NIES-3974 TaxID=2005462 RepID=UPI000B5E745D|nr:ATP-binding cassette domain-containing protein [Calothrix sp. NIES-3974]BAZ04883.1 ABC transporter-related protein [Calothrix sp. NIES-3974]
MNNLKIALKVENLNVFYGERQILRNVSLDFYENQVTAIFGYANSGKSTLLKALNRLIELEISVRYEGKIEFFGQNILTRRTNLNRLRRQIGMIFPTPNTFPMSIYDNVVYGVKLIGWYPKQELNLIVEVALRRVGLWDEVKHKLHQPANDLSLLQQQLLCIARALALQPKVLIMDEPCMSIGMLKSIRIEELIHSLRQDLTIVVATQNPQFALRVSDFIAVMGVENNIGELAEFNSTVQFIQKGLETKKDEQTHSLYNLPVYNRKF